MTKDGKFESKEEREKFFSDKYESEAGTAVRSNRNAPCKQCAYSAFTYEGRPSITPFNTTCEKYKSKPMEVWRDGKPCDKFKAK